jgi:hypothetical protein
MQPHEVKHRPTGGLRLSTTGSSPVWLGERHCRYHLFKTLICWGVLLPAKCA